ncbi:hypothetical protein AAVH_06108 [Aphelenchoides avenae]|nr:hypothetical protein AAVH_06108 [Aphelenchus avenae]
MCLDICIRRKKKSTGPPPTVNRVVSTSSTNCSDTPTRIFQRADQPIVSTRTPEVRSAETPIESVSTKRSGSALEASGAQRDQSVSVTQRLIQSPPPPNPEPKLSRAVVKRPPPAPLPVRRATCLKNAKNTSLKPSNRKDIAKKANAQKDETEKFEEVDPQVKSPDETFKGLGKDMPDFDASVTATPTPKPETASKTTNLRKAVEQKKQSAAKNDETEKFEEVDPHVKSADDTLKGVGNVMPEFDADHL